MLGNRPVDDPRFLPDVALDLRIIVDRTGVHAQVDLPDDLEDAAHILVAISRAVLEAKQEHTIP